MKVILLFIAQKIRRDNIQNGQLHKTLVDILPLFCDTLPMPQLDAGKKALRTNARRRSINDAWRQKMRAAMKAIREAVAAKDQKSALQELTKAESVLDKAARRNIIHPNKAARKKSRLRKTISALS